MQSLQPLDRCAFSTCASKQKGAQEAQRLSAFQTALGPASSAELSEAELTGLQNREENNKNHE